ncbi:hypothetical protein Ancab_025192 [Ancistrocladus abbreviatus]
MARSTTTTLRSSYHIDGLRALGLFSLLLMMQMSAGYQFQVGGNSGWTVPSDNSSVYNQWAERMRFQIGDSLLFVYPKSSDSVERATKVEYDSCNTSSYIEKYTDGRTVFTFNQSGPYYFISGNRDNCLKNEKLAVVVLADRGKKNVPNPASPPSPSAPAPAPAAEQPPSPSIPSPAPSTESPTKNDAASIAISFIGSVGAFALSSLFLRTFYSSTE